MQKLEEECIIKYKLKNGLTVLLSPVHHAPVISFNVGVKVGSLWESEDEGGLSHVLEHMVFKGTKSFKPGEIASKVEACGGELNAFTSYDQTVYYINLASRHAKIGLKLIKEMVLDATIDQEELSKELEVVIEEMRRGNDSPHRKLMQNVFKYTFPNHPFSRPVIGHENIVRKFNASKVKKFYKKWYSPHNMTLAICGDFNVKQMKSQIEQLFANYKSKKINRPKLDLPKHSRKVILKTFSEDVQANYLGIGFKLPPFEDQDIPAIDLLSYLFGSGETSRLEQIIKEQKQLATYISSFAYTPKLSGLFIIDAIVTNENIKKILPAIVEEIEWVQTELFPEENLDRMKNMMLNSLHYEKQTCEGQAKKWITYENIIDDYKYEDIYLNNLMKVTVEDIRRVAQKYLDINCANIIHHYPKSNSKKLSLSDFKKVKKKTQKNDKKYSLVEEINGVKKFIFKNGVKVITLENKRLPIISSYLAFEGGLRHENKANNGITKLMTDLIEKETISKSALEVSELCESISGNISGFAGRNSWGLSSTFISHHKKEGFNLFFDLLFNPKFSPSEFKKEKFLTLENIKQLADSPAQLAIREFQHCLFDDHPYGMPVSGTKKSVSKITRKHIQDFYKKETQSDNTVISIVGDFNTNQLLDQLSEEIQNIQMVSKNNPLKLSKASIKKKKHISQIFKQKEQSHLVLGFQANHFKSKDRYAFEVLNNILSGQGGRLFLELRDKQSLAYTVSSYLINGIDPGYFAVYMGVEPNKVNTAILGILNELEKLITQKVSRTELNRAKNYLIGSYEIDLQRRSYQASHLCFNELYGYNLNELENYSNMIMKVTPEEIQNVAKKYFKLDAYTLSIVGPKIDLKF